MNLFCYRECIVDVDPEIADSALDLGVAQERLNNTQIAGAAIDDGRLGSTRRMRPEEAWVQPNASNPLGDQSSILPRRQVSPVVPAAGKELFPGFLVGDLKVLIDCLAGLLRHLKSNGPARLLLPNCRAIDRMAVRRNVIHFQPNDVAAPELAVDRQIEQREIALPSFELQLAADRPNVFRAQWRLCAGKLALVPRNVTVGSRI